jgi:hypothetical protein
MERLRTTAEGSITGAKYVTMEGILMVENTTAGAYSVTVPIVSTLIALDRNVEDTQLRILLHVTINPNGELTVIRDNFEIICK